MTLLEKELAHEGQSKIFPTRKTRMCKGPEVGMSLMYLMNIKELGEKQCQKRKRCFLSGTLWVGSDE